MANYRNNKITQSAKGEECTLQSACCNRNPETAVFAHLNASWAGKGMGIKAHDYAGFYACSGCHDFYDGRLQMKINSAYHIDDLQVLVAVVKTLGRLIDKGILK